MTKDYRAFLEAKMVGAAVIGFDVPATDINPILKPHQVLGVQWAIRGGCRALFESFGLGKTVQQLEIVRLILEHAGGSGLIVMPLGVRQEFMRDAAMLGIPVHFIQRREDLKPSGIHLTNYETVREGKLDPKDFQVVSLDEADTLRTFGSKTFSEIVITGGWHLVPYRFAASATPDPNDYIELLGYAQFLGVMDIGHAKTRFFKRDSEHADALTLHVHKEEEFWRWVASWALVIQKPSDLGCSDEGYTLPPLAVNWHEVPSDHAAAGAEKSGQRRMFRSAAHGITDAAKEKRDSLDARMAKLMELRAREPNAKRIIWHDQERERLALEAAIPGLVTIYGSQSLDEREPLIMGFADGEIAEVGAKPVMLSSGVNWQRHCARAVFLGIGYKFRDLIQAIHRIHRFLQPSAVVVDLIYTEAERPVRAELEAKWERYDRQTARLSALIRECGLAEISMASTLQRSIGVERRVISGADYTMVNNDAVEETSAMAPDAVDLIVTSIPFSTQYEYTPSFNDFGHTDSSDHFWAQMDFLTPHLLRVLKPGRVAAIHVKDRVMPGRDDGAGVPNDSSLPCRHTQEGEAVPGVVRDRLQTIVTDVVRENAQTYRLGYSEKVKDGTRMGAGLPEYLLSFRKPPSDRSNGYADVPVANTKARYSRARWQQDAAPYLRSSGDRLLTPTDILGLSWHQVFQLYRDYSSRHVYDFEHHVALGEALERAGQLPPDFMLMPAASWHPDVWTDLVRFQTLNGLQARKGREKHLCPLPFDVVERVINHRSMAGEIVLDPFAGIGTVPYCAVKLGRRGLGIELNPQYFADGAGHCQAMESKLLTPTLFDMVALDGEPVEQSA